MPLLSSSPLPADIQCETSILNNGRTQLENKNSTMLRQTWGTLSRQRIGRIGNRKEVYLDYITHETADQNNESKLGSQHSTIFSVMLRLARAARDEVYAVRSKI
uniref:Uncharacterized protein n=1 Tax=Ananas comosus var. bracteatus TaxID=296719 RepID=A0A6V7QIK5_ANACO|nr:unnamed protein product [Ananas comosus var. bracteatus]